MLINLLIKVRLSLTWLLCVAMKKRWVKSCTQTQSVITLRFGYETKPLFSRNTVLWPKGEADVWPIFISLFPCSTQRNPRLGKLQHRVFLYVNVGKVESWCSVINNSILFIGKSFICVNIYMYVYTCLKPHNRKCIYLNNMHFTFYSVCFIF